MSMLKEGLLKANGIDMHYLDYEGSGPPLLALHGLASSAHWFHLTAVRLTDSFRFIAPDQRAHGQTDQPDTGYDWNTLSADVAGALDQLGLRRVAVMGHSWGANVALNFAALYPDRVSHLVLIDGGFFNWTLLPGMTWETFKERLAPRDIYGPKERYLGALRQELASCWSEELERIVMTMVRIDPDGSVHERLEPHNHRQVLRAMWSEPSSVAFPRITCPTLIVSAMPAQTEENRRWIKMRQEMAAAAQQAIANCRVEWIQDTIHDIGYDKPQELAQALRDFLLQPKGTV